MTNLYYHTIIFILVVVKSFIGKKYFFLLLAIVHDSTYHNICDVLKVYDQIITYVKYYFSISKTSCRDEMRHFSNNIWTCSYPYQHKSPFLQEMDHNHLHMLHKFLLETHCRTLTLSNLCDSPQYHFKRSNVSNVLPLCISLFWWRI